MTDEKVVFTPAEYMDSFDAACPQRAYRDLALASPFTAPDGMPLVTRLAELIALNRHPAVHATDGVHFNLGGKRPLIPLDLDGAEHTRFRRLLDPLFSPKSVARLADQVREVTNALIDEFAGTGEVELFEAFCVPLPSQIFIRLLGLPMSDLPRFVAFKDATVRPEGATEEERDEYKARAGESMYSYLQDVLERRRREPPRDDLIAGFLTTEVEGDRLSDEDIIDICYLLVIAGLDTVASSIS
jgi:cytochrome P450